jgi:hypothetical protein
VNGAFPSATANKLFYQMSVFIYALAESLKAKGYAVSDADARVLQTILANILTNADAVNADWNSNTGLSKILNKPTITAPVNADWNAVGGLAQILNKPSIVSADAGHSFATNGYQKIAGGFIEQWGFYPNPVSARTSVTISFPISFPNNCLNVQVTKKTTTGNEGGGGVGVDSFTLASAEIRNACVDWNDIILGFFWRAIGY